MLPSVCMGGPGSHSSMGQKWMSKTSMAQPRRTSPPLSLFPLFYSLALPRATEGTQSARPQRKQERGAKCGSIRRADLAVTTLLDYLPTSPTTNTPTHPPTHTHAHTFSPPLTPPPSLHPPTSLPPPTCQTLLDIQKRKQESCCLPGKCCLHILRLRNYTSQQKQEMIEASGDRKKLKNTNKGKCKILCNNPKRAPPRSSPPPPILQTPIPPPLPWVRSSWSGTVGEGKGFVAEQALTKPPAASSSVHAFQG